MEVVILCGLPASGKSTFCRKHFAEHVVVSKDLMKNNRRKDRRQREVIREALATGRSVVVDNTNPGRNDRLSLIALAREHEARIVGYFFDLDFDACAARNSLREPAEVVPRVGLVDIARRLEEPSIGEGYHELWRVSAVGSRFDVTPMVDWKHS